MLKKYIFIFLFFLSFSFINGQKPLFPQIEGWKLEPGTQVYDSNNLWDLIDGAADLFLEYSFVDLNLARYTNKDSIEVKAELYRHADPLNAFGMYSQERDPSNHFVNMGRQGYDDEGILNFVDGEFYVKLSTMQKGKVSSDALLLIAGQIVKNLNRDNKPLEILAYLPSEQKILNSEKFVSKNFLGYSFLNGVMTARYKGAEPFTAFIITAGSKESINKIYEELKKLPDNVFSSLNEKGVYSIKDTGSGETLMAADNSFIYGVAAYTDKAQALKFLENFTAKGKK